MDIKKQLIVLSEKDLTNKVVIPLLDVLGAFKIELFHGPREHGKDVYFAYPDLFGLYKHCCCFIKKGDIKKSGRNDIRKMKGAIEEAIIRDFISPLDNQSKVHINEILFICSGKINIEARDFISELCRKRNLPSFRIFDVDDLVDIIVNRIIKSSTYRFRPATFPGFCRTKRKPIRKDIDTILIRTPEGKAIRDK